MKKIIFLLSISLFAAVAAASAGQSDGITAKVNDIIILKSEVDEAVEALELQLEAAERKIDTKEAREKILESLVEQRLVISTANQEGVAVSPEAVGDKVNEFIENLRSRFPDQKAFEEALAAEGLNYQDFTLKIRSQVKDNLLFSKVKQKKQQEFIADVDVSENEIKKFYSDNREEFKINDEVKLENIYFDTFADENIIKAAVERIKAGAGFSEVRKDMEKIHGAKGGELGWVETSEMDASIRRAMGIPRKNKIVGPVKTDTGYHIFRVIDHEKGEVPEFETVKDKVRVILIEQKVEKLWEKWLKETKESAYIKYM
ncbi:MAG: peptidyl-prolyl cis-trans isomerase [Candidatus Goldiibacteriota bacterium]